MLFVLLAVFSCDWFRYDAPPPPRGSSALTVTTVAGLPISIPDPDRIVILEAVRSLDWCVYCIAQVRAWQEAQPQVDALGFELVVLSPDPPDVLAEAVRRRGFERLHVAHATPADFGRLGIVADPTRPELPQGTTLAVAPSGDELFRAGDIDFRTRADPGETLAALAQGRGLALTSEGVGGPTPDWDGAATLALVRAGNELALEAMLSPGFHLYGAKETTSIPVTLQLANGARAAVPDGTQTERGGQVAWLLEGSVRVTVPVPADETVQGTVGWQLCNDRTCSAPRHESFTLAPDEGRIIRPSEE